VQICLSGQFKCEKGYQALIFKLKEENHENVGVSLKLAKIADSSKNDEDVCYYLTGIDHDYFVLNKTSAILKARKRLDREQKESYELIIKASEHCYCDQRIETLNQEMKKNCEKLFNKKFDLNDATQIKLKLLLEDINDNYPKFSKKLYQIGITPDIEFGETILESAVSNLRKNFRVSSFFSF
jgi:cadherin 23